MTASLRRDPSGCAEGNALTNTIAPVYIPRRWYALLKRMADLEPGRYLLTVTVPPNDAEPDHTVLPLGKVENKR